MKSAPRGARGTLQYGSRGRDRTVQDFSGDQPRIAERSKPIEHVFSGEINQGSLLICLLQDSFLSAKPCPCDRNFMHLRHMSARTIGLAAPPRGLHVLDGPEAPW